MWLSGAKNAGGLRGVGVGHLTMQALRETGVLDEVVETASGLLVYPNAAPDSICNFQLPGTYFHPHFSGNRVEWFDGDIVSKDSGWGRFYFGYLPLAALATRPVEIWTNKSRFGLTYPLPSNRH